MESKFVPRGDLERQSDGTFIRFKPATPSPPWRYFDKPIFITDEELKQELRDRGRVVQHESESEQPTGAE